jgi:hypothetical protein
MIHAGLSLKRVQYLLKNHTVDLMHVETKSDVDRFLTEALSADGPAVEERQRETEQEHVELQNDPRERGPL